MIHAAFEKLPEKKKEKILAEGIRAFSKRPYREVSTDAVTRNCGISKGILFHYFGSKKEFYLQCLETALSRLLEDTGMLEEKTFEEVLFSAMAKKSALCMKYSDEMHLVNMAGREADSAIASSKDALLKKYAASIHAQSSSMIDAAFQTLRLKEGLDSRVVKEGVSLYVKALMDRYLLQYQKTPDAFFKDKDSIQEEIRTYLDLLLYGIVEED